MTSEGGENSSRREEHREYDEGEDPRKEARELIDEVEREQSGEGREEHERSEDDEYRREARDLIDEAQEEGKREQTEADEQQEQHWRNEAEDCVKDAVKEVEHEREEKTESAEDDNLSEWEKDVLENYGNYGADPDEVKELWREHFAKDVEDELEGSDGGRGIDEKKEGDPDDESGLEKKEDAESYYDDGSGQLYAMKTESSEKAESMTESETTEETQTTETGSAESPEGDVSKESNEVESAQSETDERTHSTENEPTEQLRKSGQECVRDLEESEDSSGKMAEVEHQGEETSRSAATEHAEEADAKYSEKRVESGNEGEAEGEQNAVEETEDKGQEVEERESTEADTSDELTPEEESWQRELNEMFNQLPEEFQEAIKEYLEEKVEEDFKELAKKHGLEDLLEDEEVMEEVEQFLRYRKARRLSPEASTEDLAEEVGIDIEQAERWEDRAQYPDAVKKVLNLEGYRVLDNLARGFREQGYLLNMEEYEEYLERNTRLELEDPMAPFEEWDREARAWIEITRMRRKGKLKVRLRNGRERYDRVQIEELSKRYGVFREKIVSWLLGESVPYLIRNIGREIVRSSTEMSEENTMASRLNMWIPEVNGVRIQSIEQLEELVKEKFPSFLKRKDYPRLIKQAALHLRLVERFQHKELKRGDIASIARETGESPTTIKRWLIEGAKPRIYHYLTRNPFDDRAERVTRILSSLNGVTDIGKLEQRLRTFYLFEVLESSKSHAENLERASLFFKFLEEYAQGGILKSIAKRMKIGKSTISEWFNGSQLPSYIRIAVEIPSNQPDTGKKWLPLRLNSQTNLPEQFIQVPDTVTSEEDLLSVLQQLKSLDTPKMREFEKEHGEESTPLAFMYLLGLIVSDGGFDSDSDLSARVVLYASKKYPWNLRLGKGFSYAMGKVGLNVERRADSTKIRDGKTTEFNVWGSQASPLLRWVKEVLLGLGPSMMKKQSPIDADWILNLAHDYRVAFLQGLADGDGYASIRSFNAGIATLTNHTFLNKLLNTLNIFPTVEKSKVRIGRYDDILKASKLPLFKHAKGRQKQLEELSKLIGLLDKSYGKVPKEEIEIIMEMHNKGMSCGEITESLWVNHGIAKSRRSVEGIIKRRK